MKMMWTVVGMLAGVSVLTAPVAHASPRGFNENHHWYCGHRRRTRPGTACACRRHPFYPSLIALALSPLVRLAINLISLTALLGLVLAPDAKADAEDYIGYLDSHGLGCGQGALKCKSDTDLIEVGRSVCYDIDKNGQTPNEAADKLLSITDGYVNKIQSTELVAAAVVNFCPWDKL
jgi:hypothetical protein